MRDATARDVRVRRLRPDDVAAIRSWHYAGRDAVYDPGDDVASGAGYHAVVDARTDELVGYCCFGPEARVPGLDAHPGTLDVGVGLRPDLVGSGWGAALTRRVLEHGARAHDPDRFRVVVLEWNERSLRTVQRAGFHEVGRLESADGRAFLVMERGARPEGRA